MSPENVAMYIESVLHRFPEFVTFTAEAPFKIVQAVKTGYTVPGWEPTYYIKFTQMPKNILRNTLSDNTILAQFSLIPMPNCCGVGILSHLNIMNPDYRQKGLGTQLYNYIEYLARDIVQWGELYAIITSRHSPGIRKLLEKNGWKQVTTSFNRNSGNMIYGMSKVFYTKDPEEEDNDDDPDCDCEHCITARERRGG